MSNTHNPDTTFHQAVATQLQHDNCNATITAQQLQRNNCNTTIVANTALAAASSNAAEPFRLV